MQWLWQGSESVKRSSASAHVLLRRSLRRLRPSSDVRRLLAWLLLLLQ
jgi:hypothetical protein